MVSSSGPVLLPSALPRGSARAFRGLSCLLLCVLVSLGVLPGRAHAEGSRWQWPLPSPHRVLAPFDAPTHRYGPGHRGIDIAVPAVGASVRAVEAGTVRFSGMVAGRGVVSVTHADGLVSTYEPVSGTVAEGRPVEAGAVLGTIAEASGASHCPGFVCLHLGARRGEDYVDPMLLLGGRGPSVLLPWTGDPAASRGAFPPTPLGTVPAAGSSPPVPGSGAVAVAAGERESGSGGGRGGGGETAGAVPAPGGRVPGRAPGPRRATLA